MGATTHTPGYTQRSPREISKLLSWSDKGPLLADFCQSPLAARGLGRLRGRSGSVEDPADLRPSRRPSRPLEARARRGTGPGRFATIS